MKTFNNDKLDNIIKSTIKNKYIYGAVLNVTNGDNSQSWCGAAGNIEAGSSYYIASINKLVISSIVLKLITEGKLTFQDFLYKFLPKNLIDGLHVYNGKDYSRNITILHMLSQTSGLPCYMADKLPNGTSVIKELEAGFDQAWPIEKVIESIKTMKPHFSPGEEGKAEYIDTNHQLLSLVIENIMNKPMKSILNQLFTELDMTKTYVCEDTNDTSYILPYFKSEQRNISKYLTSTQNDIISTAQDQMKFIRAFFNGYFYPKEKLNQLEKWNPVFFPFKYGIGIQKFYTPRYLSPFKAVPDMIGHCGSTGAVAFYVPDENIYVTGTTNQQASPNVAFRTIIKIIYSVQV